MANKQFVPVAGNLVISLRERGVFKVLAISHGGQTVAIQSFNISKQQLMDQPIEDVPSDTLLPFEEDASQAAIRIAREAMEQK
jgi:stage V sporulation protein SpoVS